jgi:hypothetical protein
VAALAESRTRRREQARAKVATLDLEAMCWGRVVEQSHRCGHGNCRCAAGELHGPYTYLRWSQGGRRRKLYLTPASAETWRMCLAIWRALHGSRAEKRRFARLCRFFG